MKYFARGMRDLLKTSELNLDFFQGLDAFQINFIEMCFQQSYDEKMGLMGEVEHMNYQIFLQYKAQQFVENYGIDEQWFKKAA